MAHLPEVRCKLLTLSPDPLSHGQVPVQHSRMQVRGASAARLQLDHSEGACEVILLPQSDLHLRDPEFQGYCCKRCHTDKGHNHGRPLGGNFRGLTLLVIFDVAIFVASACSLGGANGSGSRLCPSHQGNRHRKNALSGIPMKSSSACGVSGCNELNSYNQIRLVTIAAAWAAQLRKGCEKDRHILKSLKGYPA